MQYLGKRESKQTTDGHAGQHEQEADEWLRDQHKHYQPGDPAQDRADHAEKQRQIQQPPARAALPVAGLVDAAQLRLGVQPQALGRQRAPLERAPHCLALVLQLLLQLARDRDRRVPLRDQLLLHACGGIYRRLLLRVSPT